MITRHATIAFACLAAVACGDGRRGDPADGGRDGGTPPRTDAASGDAAPGDAAPGDGGGAPSIAVCVLGCASTSDCTTPSPAFDADNHRCEGGICRYTGCVSDAECRASFASDRYLCRDPGTGVPLCLLACTTAADCDAGSAAFDADNYRCASGVCIYEGCRDDAECVSSFGGGYGCRRIEPPPTPVPIPVAERNCVRLCATEADCGTDSGAFSDENYACRAGACEYLGCRDDAECRSSLASGAYVCR